MMNLLPKQYSLNDRPEIFRRIRTYTLFKGGLYKTCDKATALNLMKAGWYDKTHYQPNEEVLTYGTEQERRIDQGETRQSGQDIDSCIRQHEKSSSGRKSSGIGHQSGHEQHNPDLCDDGGTQYFSETIRSGTSNSEVIRKRGRPKREK
jgi:hypothetical protein